MTAEPSELKPASARLRQLPSMGALLERAEADGMVEKHGARLLKACLNELLDEQRSALRSGSGSPSTAETRALLAEAERRLAPSYRRVINATGTVLHTNLGRAPLGDSLAAVARELAGYSPLEFSLETGRRGSRGASVERMLRWLTGAPAALVVNNCAAAMVLLLTAHAQGREVVVSRGELVEIGGGFRIPDILELSGARLVEVGTTNRTRIGDFRRAVNPETGLLLTTHSSNFAMVGFTESPSHDELLELGRECGVPVAFDLGSGMLSDVVAEEPTVAQAARFPLAAFSGDKLLGGPQCGVVIGSTELVDACRRHPFYRAFRCGKVTLALLEETLRRHARNPDSVRAVAHLTVDRTALQARAADLEARLSGHLPEPWNVNHAPTEGQVGGGSLPGGTVPSWGVHLWGSEVARLAVRLRRARTPVIGRLEKERLVLDLLAVSQDEEPILFESVLEALS